MRTARHLAICVILLAACARESPLAVPTTGSADTVPPAAPAAVTTTAAPPRAQPIGSVRLLFAGDVMLGRRVAQVAVAEGPDLFRDVRFVVSSADIAAANLESPLTIRPHLAATPNELEADPDTARLLAGAGFDLMSVANNHAGDAGPDGVTDTIAALAAAGVQSLGAGTSSAEAGAAVVRDHDGLMVAFLAFDATGVGLAATAATPGVAAYSRASAQAAIEAASVEADLVVVSVHGGVEYLLDPDPILGDIADDLVTWGADVVWGHGPHVPQPVTVADTPGGGRAVVATSLGNFLFDQQRTAAQTGLVLEVLASADGVVAYRVGRAEHGDLRVGFVAWDAPSGPAVLLDGEWWSLIAGLVPAPSDSVAVPGFGMGDVTVAAIGDVTADGGADLVVSYRHPFRSNAVNGLFPDRMWADPLGRSAHLGVFDPDSLDPTWAAGTLLRPVAALAACDGGVALAFDTLDATEIVATGAWVWHNFGFAVADELAGTGTPVCIDVDLDGLLDPVIVDR